MKRILLLWLSPVLLTSMSLSVVSTEVEFVWQPASYSILHETAYRKQFHSLPANPNVFTEVDTYLDKNLTRLSNQIVPNQIFHIVAWEVNDFGQAVFRLSDGRYLAADTSKIYDDTVLEVYSTEQTMWLPRTASFVTSPINNQSQSLPLSLRPYQAVTISEIARTPLGQFAKVDGLGWIDTQYLTSKEDRMALVQELLQDKYASENIGIYVKQVSSGKEAGIHQDKLMYSASIAKLPLLYYVQEKIDAGQVKVSEQLTYTEAVNQFVGSYHPAGSGSISKTPDNLPYAIGDLLNVVAKESDNVASNILAYYVTNGYDESYQVMTQKLAGKEWNMTDRMASPRMAGLVMQALYEQDGLGIAALQETQFDDQRISRDIVVPVAHKIGNADDLKHDVAIIYADEPFVLSIFTDKADYEIISQIANDIYGILQ